ncbi:sugar-binding domain-containing protein [Halalkalibacter oceani]|uniref:sugar-binding domain-containing protein n=1 Tax=Halalkalibacter oceani TaxID=1653776 RepID=UPI00339B1C21
MYPKSELIKVAKLYYEAGLTQQQIAEKLLYSRPTISRMLDAALKTGIVNVTIQYSLESVYELEQEIKNTFNLKKVFVAPSYIEVSSLINKDVGKELANYLTELCQPGDVLGVSWGTTLSYVSEALTRTKIEMSKFTVQNFY